MQIISHRVNTIAQLRDVPKRFGVEIDIRSTKDWLYLHHDPFTDGERLEDWLQHFEHQFLILNVKEEGLESECLRQLAKRHIENFFFLDQSFPFLMKSIQSGEQRCAVRVSEYESIETALNLSGRVKWIWLDCFSRLSVDRKHIAELKSAGFNLCIVSPELQGRFDVDEIRSIKATFHESGHEIDAVCTKLPAEWEA